MKVSELIRRLEEPQEKHGDLPVNRDCCSCGESPVQDVEAYADHRHDVSKDKPAVEIFVH